MKFVVIDPITRSVRTVDHETLREAQASAGLGNVDHGMLSRNLGYVVYEFGLFVPAERQYFFGMAGRLFAGRCVMYGCDERGETVPLMKSQIPDVRWFLGKNDVEAAIVRGEIIRPYLAIGPDKIWEWPEPRPI